MTAPILDARHWTDAVGPATKLAGLPVFVRAVRTLKRAGITPISVLSGEHQPLLERLLRRYGDQDAVTYSSEEPTKDTPTIAAAAP